MRTIDEVIDELTTIVERARSERSRLGYFAALYRNVTVRVRDGIAQKRFRNGEQLERLDVVFALRYIEAMRAYRAGTAPTRSWAIAFRLANSWPPLIVQHLLLGINAHINLDLAIAAAETAPGTALPGLKPDFDEINDVLGEMLDDVQTRLARVSPWYGILDRLGCRTDEEILTFGLGKSRKVAWQAALALNERPRADWPAQIDVHDRIVATLAVPIHNPGLFLRSALFGIRLRENMNVPAVIDALSVT